MEVNSIDNNQNGNEAESTTTDITQLVAYQELLASGRLDGLDEAQKGTFLSTIASKFNESTNTVIDSQVKFNILEDVTQTNVIVGTDNSESILGDTFKANVIDGLYGDDNITGGNYSDIIYGGNGDDVINGKHGDDIYIFNCGDGTDVISDSYGSDLIKFGAGVELSSFGFVRHQDDLQIDYGNEDDHIIISDYFKYTSRKIEDVELSDGSVFNIDDLLVDLRIEYSLGDGNLKFSQLPGDKLLHFKDGITPSDLEFSRYYSDLKINIVGTNDYVQIVNWYHTSGEKLDGISFLDGSQLNTQQIESLVRVKGDDGDNTLKGYSSNPDIFIGGKGNDVLYGYSGDDKYVFNIGDGTDTVSDSSGIDSIVFGEGISADQLSYIRRGGDLYINIGATSDQIKVENFFKYTSYKVESIEFADGSSLNLLEKSADAKFDYSLSDGDIRVTDVPSDQIINFLDGINSSDIELCKYFNDLKINFKGNSNLITLVGWYSNDSKIDSFTFADGTVWGLEDIKSRVIVNGTDGNDTLNGSNEADVLKGGKGNDRISGYEGDDRYLFNLGDGVDTIYESAGVDTFVFGEGILPSQIDYIRRKNDLHLKVSDADELIVPNYFSDSKYEVERLEFSDGTNVDLLNVSESARLEYHNGDGYFYTNDLQLDKTLYFGPGIEQSDLEFLLRGIDLKIVVNGSSDVVYIGHWYRDNKLDFINFEDGSSLNTQAISELIRVKGTDSSESLYASDENDTIIGGKGDDRLYGKDGDDKFVFGLDDGVDTIYDTAGNDTIVFGEGISVNDLDYEQRGDDLVIKINGQDRVIIDNYYYDENNKVEKIQFSDGSFTNVFDNKDEILQKIDEIAQRGFAGVPQKAEYSEGEIAVIEKLYQLDDLTNIVVSFDDMVVNHENGKLDNVYFNLYVTTGNLYFDDITEAQANNLAVYDLNQLLSTGDYQIFTETLDRLKELNAPDLIEDSLINFGDVLQYRADGASVDNAILEAYFSSNNIAYTPADKLLVDQHMDTLFLPLLRVTNPGQADLTEIIEQLIFVKTGEQVNALDLFNDMKAGEYYVNGIKIDKPFIDQMAGIINDPLDIKSSVDAYVNTKYSDLFNNYIRVVDGKGFIADPSQSNQIVSEGQSYWQLITTKMAQVDPTNASSYQADFDTILAGTNHMISLANAAGNTGVFPAWKVAEVSGDIVLDPATGVSAANSAADADLDLIKSLIYADSLVQSGVWEDKGYAQQAQQLINSATFGVDSLFTIENGVKVLRPSEDWDGFHFTDYNSPATYTEISDFAGQVGMGQEYVNFWNEAAADGMKLFKTVLRDVGEFASHVEFDIQDADTITATAVNGTTQTYDGIRSAWKMGEYILSSDETDSEFQTALDSIVAGLNNQYTYSEEMDKAMYLPLVVASGDKDSVDRMLADIAANEIAGSKYFDQTLVMLGLLSSVYPSKLDFSLDHVAPTDMQGIYAGKKSTVMTEQLDVLGINAQYINDPNYVQMYEELLDMFNGINVPYSSIYTYPKWIDGQLVHVENKVDGARIYDLYHSSEDLKVAYITSFFEQNMGVGYNTGYYYQGQPLWEESNGVLANMNNNYNAGEMFDHLQLVAQKGEELKTNLDSFGIGNFYSKEMDPLYYEVADKVINYCNVNSELNVSGLDYKRIYKTIDSSLDNNPGVNRDSVINQAIQLVLRTNLYEDGLSSKNIKDFKFAVGNDSTYDLAYYELASQLYSGIDNQVSIEVSFRDFDEYLDNGDLLITNLNNPLFNRAINADLVNINDSLYNQSKQGLLSEVVARIEGLKSSGLIFSNKVDFEYINHFYEQNEDIDESISYAYMLTNKVNLTNNNDVIRLDKDVNEMTTTELSSELTKIGVSGYLSTAYVPLARELVTMFNWRVKPNFTNEVPISWIYDYGNWKNIGVEMAYLNKAKDKNWNSLAYPTDRDDALRILDQVAPILDQEDIIRNIDDINTRFDKFYPLILEKDNILDVFSEILNEYSVDYENDTWINDTFEHYYDYDFYYSGQPVENQYTQFVFAMMDSGDDWKVWNSGFNLDSLFDSYVQSDFKESDDPQGYFNDLERTLWKIADAETYGFMSIPLKTDYTPNELIVIDKLYDNRFELSSTNMSFDKILDLYAQGKLVESNFERVVYSGLSNIEVDKYFNILNSMDDSVKAATKAYRINVGRDNNGGTESISWSATYNEGTFSNGQDWERVDYEGNRNNKNDGLYLLIGGHLSVDDYDFHAYEQAQYYGGGSWAQVYKDRAEWTDIYDKTHGWGWTQRDQGWYKGVSWQGVLGPFPTIENVAYIDFSMECRTDNEVSDLGSFYLLKRNDGSFNIYYENGLINEDHQDFDTKINTLIDNLYYMYSIKYDSKLLEAARILESGNYDSLFDSSLNVVGGGLGSVNVEPTYGYIGKDGYTRPGSLQYGLKLSDTDIDIKFMGESVFKLDRLYNSNNAELKARLKAANEVGDVDDLQSYALGENTSTLGNGWDCGLDSTALISYGQVDYEDGLKQSEIGPFPYNNDLSLQNWSGITNSELYERLSSALSIDSSGIINGTDNINGLNSTITNYLFEKGTDIHEYSSNVASVYSLRGKSNYEWDVFLDGYSGTLKSYLDDKGFIHNDKIPLSYNLNSIQNQMVIDGVGQYFGSVSDLFQNKTAEIREYTNFCKNIGNSLQSLAYYKADLQAEQLDRKSIGMQFNVAGEVVTFAYNSRNIGSEITLECENPNRQFKLNLYDSNNNVITNPQSPGSWSKIELINESGVSYVFGKSAYTNSKTEEEFREINGVPQERIYTISEMQKAFKLSEVINPSGIRQVYSYEGVGETGSQVQRLSSIEIQKGSETINTINFNYDEADLDSLLIKNIEYLGENEQLERVVYEYNDNGLYQVKKNGDILRTYTYESKEYGEGGLQLLSTVTTDTGKNIQYGYEFKDLYGSISSSDEEQAANSGYVVKSKNVNGNITSWNYGAIDSYYAFDPNYNPGSVQNSEDLKPRSFYFDTITKISPDNTKVELSFEDGLVTQKNFFYLDNGVATLKESNRITYDFSTRLAQTSILDNNEDSSDGYKTETTFSHRTGSNIIGVPQETLIQKYNSAENDGQKIVDNRVIDIDQSDSRFAVAQSLIAKNLLTLKMTESKSFNQTDIQSTDYDYNSDGTVKSATITYNRQGVNSSIGTELINPGNIVEVHDYEYYDDVNLFKHKMLKEDNTELKKVSYDYELIDRYDSNGVEGSGNGVNDLLKVIETTSLFAKEIDASGNLVTSNDVVSSYVTNRIYDLHSGRLVEEIDTSNRSTKYSYDEKGRVSEIQYYDETTESWIYDDINRKQTYTDRNGFVVIKEFDIYGNLVFVDNPDGVVDSRYEYDINNNQTRSYSYTGEVDSSMIYTDFNSAYDYFNRTTTTFNEKGQTVTNEYSSDSQNLNDIVTTTVNSEYITESESDAFGGVDNIERQDINGTVVQHVDINNDQYNQPDSIDFNSNDTLDQTRVNDINGSQVLNQSAENLQETNISGIGFSQITRGIDGQEIAENLLVLKDGLDRVISIQEKVDGTWNSHTTYSYDENIASQFTNVSSYQVQELTSVSTPDTESKYIYGINGNVVEEQLAIGSNEFATNYDWTGNRLNSISLWNNNAQANKSISYGYDSLNRVNSMTFVNKTFNYAYEADGKIDSITYPNGMIADYTYDNTRNLKKIELIKGGEVVRELGYSYENGKVVGKTDIISTTGVSTYSATETYDNDAHNNLEIVTKTLSDFTSATDSFVYDDNYFLTQHNVDGQTLYQYDVLENTNRIDSMKVDLNGDGDFDDAGEVNSIGYSTDTLRPNEIAGIVRDFDSFGNLTVNGTHLYTFDHNHRRVKDNDSYLIYDQADRLIAKADDQGRYTNIYLWGPNNTMLGQVRIDPDLNPNGGNIDYFLPDYLGNNMTTFNHEGNIKSHNQYSVWGDPTSVYKASGVTEDNFIFTGKLYDADTKSYNLGKRVYDPRMKRFLVDDAVNPDLSNLKSYNPYVYANNDPVNFWDPDGNEIVHFSNPAPKGIRYFKDATILGMITGVYNWYLHDRDKHYSRNSQNVFLPQTAPDSYSEGFVMASWAKTTCHRFGEYDNVIKMVHPDGREAVYSGDGRSLITDPSVMGSFNWVNASESGGWHLYKDVRPWIPYGNSANDPTNPLERIWASLIGFKNVIVEKADSIFDPYVYYEFDGNVVDSYSESNFA